MGDMKKKVCPGRLLYKGIGGMRVYQTDDQGLRCYEAVCEVCGAGFYTGGKTKTCAGARRWAT